jgi:hypothetical protein
VKEHLPASLRPDGDNPLQTLHTALSEGIHELSDEECLQRAGDIRRVLGYFIPQLAAKELAKRDYKRGMQGLRDSGAAKQRNDPS